MSETKRGPGQPRKAPEDRLETFPRFRAKPSTLDWYQNLEAKGERSKLARAAVEAITLLDPVELEQAKYLADQRGQSLASILAYAVGFMTSIQAYPWPPR